MLEPAPPVLVGAFECEAGPAVAAFDDPGVWGFDGTLGFVTPVPLAGAPGLWTWGLPEPAGGAGRVVGGGDWRLLGSFEDGPPSPATVHG